MVRVRLLQFPYYSPPSYYYVDYTVHVLVSSHTHRVISAASFSDTTSHAGQACILFHERHEGDASQYTVVIETTIERDKKGGFVVLPLPLTVLQYQYAVDFREILCESEMAKATMRFYGPT